MTISAVLDPESDIEWRRSVVAAVLSSRSSMLERRCGSCQHLLFVHSERPEGRRPIGSCHHARCDCVTVTPVNTGW
jgi:hypothetical protein